MNTEEKAKAYDEVLERAREEYEIYKGIKDVYHCEALERIFHKLAESEDEKIRKALTNWFKECHWDAIDDGKLKKEDIIAWLEEQAQKPKDVTYTHEVKTGNGNIKALVTEKVQLPEKYEKQGEQKPTDNEMIEILRTEYEKGRADAIVEMQKPWSEEDGNHFKSILSTIECCKVQFPNSPAVVEAHNADAEWLKSLKDRVQPQPKQEWSEEDEKKQNYLIALLQNSTMNNPALKSVNEGLEDWLKSLKDRVQPKQEWSEEDEAKFESVEYWLKQALNKGSVPEYMNWLKSLKPQNRWKPSDEQINALAKNVEYVNVSCTQPILKGLLEDLKKLK